MNLSQRREYLHPCKTPHHSCHCCKMVLALLDFQIILFFTIDSYLVHLFYLEASLLGPQFSDISIYTEE